MVNLAAACEWAGTTIATPHSHRIQGVKQRKSFRCYVSCTLFCGVCDPLRKSGTTTLFNRCCAAAQPPTVFLLRIEDLGT
ncbi:hypothetical protein EVAR_6403_1 [Eumeta japonica]|uniref:Uncharacterized protein n=1 Tax=Eumeta variegata TaxID=151549 RepID=A0A4C1TFZ8_EUMVA|nr:hypothetical protein EVAR_6403_1 [Eumeta japonica]